MPLYEYQCNKCGFTFEKFFGKFRGVTPCPKCGAAANKIISKVSIQFKGKGFYVNDSKTNKDRDGSK